MSGLSPRRLLTPRRGAALGLAAALLGGVAGIPAVSGLAGASTTTTVSNLLSGDTLSLQSGVGIWTGSNVFGLTTKTWSDGTGSLVIKPKTVGQAAVVQTGAGRSAVRATAGNVYSGDFFVRTAATAEQVQPFLAWYDGNGHEITGERVLGSLNTDATAGWLKVIVSGIAPANASYVALGAKVPTSVVGELHYLSTPSLTRGTAGSPGLAGPLHTTGNKIYDANNAPVTLRGMNRSGTYNSAPDNLTQYDINRIKTWGGNVVRLTVGEHVWLPGCPTYDPATPGIVDQAVKWINGAGMLAVIDLQWSAPTCDTGGLNPMPDAKSKTFWQQVATRYANAPLVAFDLYNEPHDVSDAVWANGGTATTSTGVDYTAVGMKELYDTVRAAGAQNLVFVGGLGYASEWPSTAPLAGTSNVVYAVHAYNCDRPSTCTNGTGINWMLDRFLVAGQTNPIMITEFGWPAAGSRDAQAFNTNVINYAERQGWGWMPWTWDVNGNCSTSTYWDLIANGSCGSTGTYQPSPAGMPILTGLRKNT